MAYQDIVEIHDSSTLRARITACAALEGNPDPEGWAFRNAWGIASQPGWAESWASAREVVLDETVRGKDGSVITDAMILSAVQAITTAQGAV